MVEEAAELRVFLYLEVDAAVVLVGHALFDQPFDDLLDFRNVVSRARGDVRVEVAEAGHLLAKARVLLVAEFFPVAAGLVGAQQHIVVDIRDVLDVGDAAAEKAEVADEDVEDSVGEGVAQV